MPWASNAVNVTHIHVVLRWTLVFMLWMSHIHVVLTGPCWNICKTAFLKFPSSASPPFLLTSIHAICDNSANDTGKSTEQSSGKHHVPKDATPQPATGQSYCFQSPFATISSSPLRFPLFSSLTDLASCECVLLILASYLHTFHPSHESWIEFPRNWLIFAVFTPVLCSTCPG